MADTAYDSDPIRQAIAEKGALAVIPNNPSRSSKHPLDKHLYAQRHLVECCFSKLKQFRRVATRYEKTARNFLAVITVAAIALWIICGTAPEASAFSNDGATGAVRSYVRPFCAVIDRWPR
jgi:transposase